MLGRHAEPDGRRRAQSIRGEAGAAARKARAGHAFGRRHGQHRARERGSPDHAAGPASERYLGRARRHCLECAGPSRAAGVHPHGLECRCRPGIDQVRPPDRKSGRRRWPGLHARCRRSRDRSQWLGIGRVAEFARAGEGDGHECLWRRSRGRRRASVRGHGPRDHRSPRCTGREEALGQEYRLAHPLRTDGRWRPRHRGHDGRPHGRAFRARRRGAMVLSRASRAGEPAAEREPGAERRHCRRSLPVGRYHRAENRRWHRGVAGVALALAGRFLARFHERCGKPRH